MGPEGGTEVANRLWRLAGEACRMRAPPVMWRVPCMAESCLSPSASGRGPLGYCRAEQRPWLMTDACLLLLLRLMTQWVSSEAS